MLDFIERHSSPEPNTGCWLWTGELTAKGYGRATLSTGRYRAHRVAWEAVHGPIPLGMVVCHRCDVRWCVNPAHLFLGTPADNNRDMKAKGRAVTPPRPISDIALLSLRLALTTEATSMAELGRRFGVTRSFVFELKERERLRRPIKT